MRPQNQCHKHRLKKRKRRSTFSTLTSTTYSSSSSCTILLLLLSTTITTPPQYYTAVNAQQSSCDPCIISGASFIQIPDTNCEQFVQCSGSKTVQTFTCQSGLIYDANLSQCNWATQATCGPDPVCPTPELTEFPTISPTVNPPTFLPTDDGDGGGASAGGGLSPSSSGQQPPLINPYSSSSSNAITRQSSILTFTAITPIRYPHHSAIWAHMNANKLPISNTLLGPNYSYMDFYRALRSMSEQGYAVPVEDDDDDMGEIIDEFGNRASWKRSTFYLGEHIILTPTYTAGDAAVIGLVNIALFVSQSMSSSLVYGLCDGIEIMMKKQQQQQQQLDGISTNNIQPSYENMNCPLNERYMECSSSNTNNYDNVSYHGRGTLLTRGQCQYGKLDYYLGATAHVENRPSRYPEINFCSQPSSVCPSSSSSSSSEIQWIAGLFTWIDMIQSYNSNNWNYVRRLHEFVAGGMLDVTFIYEVSSLVVTQGDSISSTDVENNDVEQRWKYFVLTLDTFGLRRPVARQS